MKAAAVSLPATGWFPWNEVMRVGLGLLRLEPKTFWAMSLTEFRFAAGIAAGDRALGRGELDALMKRFPDMQGR